MVLGALQWVHLCRATATLASWRLSPSHSKMSHWHPAAAYPMLGTVHLLLSQWISTAVKWFPSSVLPFSCHTWGNWPSKLLRAPLQVGDCVSYCSHYWDKVFYKRQLERARIPFSIQFEEYNPWWQESGVQGNIVSADREQMNTRLSSLFSLYAVGDLSQWDCAPTLRPGLLCLVKPFSNNPYRHLELHIPWRL